MKSGWKTVTLKEISKNIQYGYTASASGELIGPKFLRITDIVPALISWNSVPYCEIAEKDLGKYLLHDGDIVIARTGATTGYAKYIKGNQDSVFASYLVRVQLKPDVDRLFIGKIVESDIYKKYIHQNIGGSAQPNANAKILTSFPINLPPLHAQHKIARILSSYDDLIENNTRRIQILEEIAERIYREWFVYYRYPGHENQEMVKSEMGMIPEGWQVKRLKDFGEVITGKTPSKKKPEYYGGDIPFIKTPDMHGNIFCILTSEYLSNLGADSQNKKTLPPNTLCVSCIGTAGIVSITAIPSQTNQQINSIVTNNESVREFLYFSLLDLKETINLYGATGATMVNLSKGKFEALKIATAPGEIISNYHTTTKPMFDEIKTLQHANINLRQTRDLLLPKLISGRIDVSERDIDTGIEG